MDKRGCNKVNVGGNTKETGFSSKWNRRNFLKDASKTIIATCAGASLAMTSSCSNDSGSDTVTIPDLPWPYKIITSNNVSEKGYTAYYEKGCMYGVFEAIIGELRDIVGAPYIYLPTEIAVYGKAGVFGWGTLCGAMNGAAAAISLVSSNASTLVKELYGWYSTEALPNFTPTSPVTTDTIVTSIATSPLCHVSVQNWVDTSGYKAHSPQRSERCARLVGSVVSKVIELLNADADSSFSPAYTTPDDVTTCINCHGKSGSFDNLHQEQGASCVICHPAEQHP